MPEQSNNRPRGKPFVKGDPRAGRPKGTPNKATVAVREAARAIVEDPDYRAGFVARAMAGTLAPPLEAMLWHYAYGKPKETAEVSFPGVENALLDLTPERREQLAREAVEVLRRSGAYEPPA